MENINKIDGVLFEKLVIGGALKLKENLQEVNDLNVFPIPDGDTGDNMFLTISGGVDAIKNVDSNSLTAKAEALSNGMMLSARGNSGVILSQYFTGFSKAVKGLDEANITQVVDAFLGAARHAYTSVIQPVEGTMLTVAREAAEYTFERKNEFVSINEYIDSYKEEMKKSLDNTPELLATLKEAGVIDSGGAGLLYIVEGFKDVLDGKEIIEVESNNTQKKVDLSKFNEDSVMKYGYCTEFLLQLQKIKVDVYAFEIDEIVKYLETIGDSIVCYKAGTIVKVHVHTLTPYKALEFCQQFGEFLTIKIENMTLQHSEVVEKKNTKKKGIKKKYGVVTCATGQGLIDTFYGFGVDEVIDGGQCHNPSTKDFIDAFERINADYIYVLPNNSNIIMTANESKELYKDATIYVINTKDFGQAYAALSLLDMNLDDPDEIARGLEENMQDVCTGMISKSIRDANINHVDIHEDDYIGFSGKTMITSHKDKMETYFELIDKLDVRNKNFIITFFGKDVTEDEKKAVRERLSEEYKNVEAYDINGGQDVYDFIIIIE